MYSPFTGDVEHADRATAAAVMKTINALPEPWLETIDVANAVLYLASDEARYVTGTAYVVNAGQMAPFSAPTPRRSRQKHTTMTDHTAALTVFGSRPCPHPVGRCRGR